MNNVETIPITSNANEGTIDLHLSTSKQKSEFETSFIKAQSEFTEITRDKKGMSGNQKYKYADISNLIAMIRPILFINGLGFRQPISRFQDSIQISTIIVHKNGHCERSLFSLPIPPKYKDDETWSRDPKDIGKIITYGRRYALGSVFGLASEEDDDARGVGNSPPRSQNRPKNNVQSNLISKPQLTRLYTIASTKGLEREDIQPILTKYKYKSSTEIKTTDYNPIVDWIQALPSKIPIPPEPSVEPVTEDEMNPFPEEI